MVFTPIHRALGLPAGDLSEDLYRQAIEHHIRESADLDWKRKPYDPKNTSSREELAKDVAAMANSGGGWIVFGMAEDNQNDAARAIHPIEWTARDERRTREVCYQQIAPPVQGIEFYPVDVGSGKIVAMRIPDSADAPHFSRKGDDAFRAPRRSGAHTVSMSDREIERAFRERFQHAHEREQSLADAFDQASQALSREDGVFLALAALPMEPAISRFSLTKANVNEMQRDDPINALWSGKPDARWQLGDVRVGLRQWVIRNYGFESWTFRKCLWHDGTVLGAYQLGGVMMDWDRRDEYPVDGPNHCRSVDIEAGVVDFVTLMRRHALERQVNGGYRVRAGLIGPKGKPIFIRGLDPEDHTFLDSAQQSVPINRFQPVSTIFDPLAEISEVIPHMNDLARDLINQGGIQALDVMALPNQDKDVDG